MSDSPWAAGEHMELTMLQMMVGTLDVHVKTGRLVRPVDPRLAVRLLMPDYGGGACLMFMRHLERAVENAEVAAALMSMVVL